MGGTAGQEAASLSSFAEPGSASLHIEGRSLFFQVGARDRRIVLWYVVWSKEPMPQCCLTQPGCACSSVERRGRGLKGISVLAE